MRSGFASTAAAVLSLCANTGLAASEGNGVVSCSAEAAKLDSCSVMSPGGVIIFRQRFEPEVGSDHGRWGIDGVEILDCDGRKPVKTVPFSKRYAHEEIVSLCLRSTEFGGEAGYATAEAEWAQGEVGEGVEEIWERSWNNAGRKISTLSPSCLKHLPKGSEVPLFLNALHELNSVFTVAEFLSLHDIVPSPDVTYALSEITAALSIHGQEPLISCVGDTLSTVSWPLHSRGPFQDGKYQRAEIPHRTSNCPRDGVIYPPSTSGTYNANHRRSTTTEAKWDPIYRPTPRAVTMSNDDSKLYYPREGDGSGEQDDLADRTDPTKLGFFKGRDEDRDNKPDNLDKSFGRDEL